MRKALLVDDDFLVRSYLKMLPSWEKAGFEIIADVRDGEEALEVLKKETIDLVVTDIAMPLMDGIQLIKRIRESYGDIYVIALSCHDEFEYVKEAMKEGADEYVLKNTLDEASLLQMLNVASEKIAHQDTKSGTQKNNAKEQETVFAGVNQKLLYFNQVLSGSMTEEEREKERKKAGVRGEYQNSAVIAIKLDEYENVDDPWSELKMEKYCLEFLEHFQKEVDQVAAEIEVTEDVIYIGKGVFCCFIDLSGMHRSSVMYQKLTTIASTCYKLCKEEEYAYLIGVSHICIGTEALRQAYQQARQMIKAGFYQTDSILYYETEKVTSRKLPKEAQAFLEEFEQLRKRGSEEELRKRIQNAVEAFRREWTDGTVVRNWIKKIEQMLPTLELDEKYVIRSIEDVDQFFEEMIRTFYDYKDVVTGQNLSNPVRKAVEYVLAHYKEDIGLNDVAQVAGVSSSYLSYLFSQEMGMGFTNYLLTLRIEHAKKLLKESDLKIGRIAEKTGFHDYHYFSKVFKKIVGVSPAKYSEQVK